MTLRDLYNLTAAARGHWVLCGTPKRIADTLEHWFVEEAADGFNIMPPYFPGAFDEFVDLVVPELQARGLFRREYQGTTLRDHLGSRARRPLGRASSTPTRARATDEGGTSMDVHVIRHPLVDDVLAALRDRHTPSDAFRQLARRVSLLVAAEATRDLPLAEATVETPLEETTVRRLAARVVAVPVLRAGLGMLGRVSRARAPGPGGLLRARARRGNRGRAPLLREGAEGSGRRGGLPPRSHARHRGLGGHGHRGLAGLGARGVRLLSIVAAPEGLELLRKAAPDARVYTAAIDRGSTGASSSCPGWVTSATASSGPRLER